jgi:hypothetical protein
LQKLPPSSADEPFAPDAIRAHARSLHDSGREEIRSRLHAEVCSNRQIEVLDQKLRTFVVKHSVIRIHCVASFMLILIAAEVFGPVQVRGRLLAAFMLLAAAIIAASTRSIGKAIKYSSR